MQRRLESGLFSDRLNPKGNPLDLLEFLIFFPSHGFTQGDANDRLSFKFL